MDSKIPKLKAKSCIARVTLAVEEDLKKDLRELKEIQGIDVPEWLRGLIRDGVRKIKAS